MPRRARRSRGHGLRCEAMALVLQGVESRVSSHAPACPNRGAPRVTAAAATPRRRRECSGHHGAARGWRDNAVKQLTAAGRAEGGVLAAEAAGGCADAGSQGAIQRAGMPRNEPGPDSPTPILPTARAGTMHCRTSMPRASRRSLPITIAPKAGPSTTSPPKQFLRVAESLSAAKTAGFMVLSCEQFTFRRATWQIRIQIWSTSSRMGNSFV